MYRDSSLDCSWNPLIVISYSASDNTISLDFILKNIIPVHGLITV